MRLDKIQFNDFSRNKIHSLIKLNKVLVNGKLVNKPSYEVNESDKVEFILDEYNFASRAGYKLLRAINIWGLDFKDKQVLDVGASTGGFTSCALYFGAKHVYAVDVGDSQLVDSLKNDSRVTSIENKNILDLTKKDVNNIVFDYIVIDVSFVSLESIIGCLKRFMDDNTLIVALIKPQFETIKYQNKTHIIKDPTIHKIILKDTISKINHLGFNVLDLNYSPIKGGKGNIEFISLLTLRNAKNNYDIDSIVKEAHLNFKKED